MAMFTLTVFEVLKFEGRSVLWHTQRVTSKGRVKFSVKNQENVWLMLELLKKWLLTSLEGFQWHFWFCLTFLVPEQWKNLISEISIIPQILGNSN